MTPAVVCTPLSWRGLSGVDVNAGAQGCCDPRHAFHPHLLQPCSRFFASKPRVLPALRGVQSPVLTGRVFRKPPESLYCQPANADP
eukprot:3347648-Rhodomonas_salina.1